MNTERKIIAALVALLLVAGVYEVRKWVVNAKTEGKAEALAELQPKFDAEIKKLRDADEQRQKQYEQKSQFVAKADPQQIVVKLPEYVPQAPKPIVIVGPNNQDVKPKDGDAIVPAEDIRPISQALLDGQKCKADLNSCQLQMADWREKYEAKEQEAKLWKKAAKAGSVWKRMGKDALKIGIGVGIGYALKR